MRIRSESIARIALSLSSRNPSLKLHRLYSALAVTASLSAGSVAAALDVSGLDRATDPFADFYRFANQRWVDSIDIPEDRPRLRAFDQRAERNTPILVVALDQPT